MKKKNNENKAVENTEKIYTIWDIPDFQKQKSRFEPQTENNPAPPFFKRFLRFVHG